MADRMLAPGQTARHDFGKIKTFLPLPNLIDVQRRSYEDFLQMDLLPAERGEVGLEAVFRGVFPFSDFRETCALEYVSFRIGDWASRSGRLEGIQHLRFSCEHCGATVRVKDAAGEPGRVPGLRAPEPEQGHDRRGLRDPGRAPPPVHRGRVPGARPHLRRAAEGDLPAEGLRQGERPDGEERPEGVADPRHQGGGGLLRRHPPHDGQRDLHHQRHGARHRLAAPPFARRLLHPGGGAHPHREDHSLPRLLGGVRDRLQGPLRRPDRPQAEVPRDGLPPRARPRERRADPQEVLLGRRPDLRQGQGAPRRCRPTSSRRRTCGRSTSAASRRTAGSSPTSSSTPTRRRSSPRGRRSPSPSTRASSAGSSSPSTSSTSARARSSTRRGPRSRTTSPRS